MHSQPPKSPNSPDKGRDPQPPGPLIRGSYRGTLETSLESELLVNVYLFLVFTIIRDLDKKLSNYLVNFFHEPKCFHHCNQNTPILPNLVMA